MRNAAIVAATLAGLSTPAAAHHSFDGSFDRDRLVTINGTVTKFALTVPHTFIELEVVNPDGSTQLWHVETTQAPRLEREGWTPLSIAAGERLIVEGWPAHDGRPYMRIKALAHPDGTPLALWLPAGPSPIPSPNTPG